MYMYISYYITLHSIFIYYMYIARLNISKCEYVLANTNARIQTEYAIQKGARVDRTCLLKVHAQKQNTPKNNDDGSSTTMQHASISRHLGRQFRVLVKFGQHIKSVYDLDEKGESSNSKRKTCSVHRTRGNCVAIRDNRAFVPSPEFSSICQPASGQWEKTRRQIEGTLDYSSRPGTVRSAR